MNKRQINPWTWQEPMGFSQAWRVDDAAAVVFLAGQGPLDDDGALIAGDFEEQVRQTFRNLRTVLEAAGASLDAIVHLRAYLTDVTKVRDYGRVRAEFITGAAPAGTVVGVTGLAVPGMRVEVEAAAVI
jgi:enamine deaminase RidA (YjgF/YER057c/UK114 family)